MENYATGGNLLITQQIGRKKGLKIQQTDGTSYALATHRLDLKLASARER